MSEHDSTEIELAEARERIGRLEAVVEAGLLVNSTLDLRQLAVLQDRNGIAEAQRFIQIMGDEDDGFVQTFLQEERYLLPR